MSLTTSYLGLAVLHVLRIFVVNPIQFRWQIKHGFEPMPGDLLSRTRALNRRYLGFIVYGAVMFGSVLLMSCEPISARDIGWNFCKWQR